MNYKKEYKNLLETVRNGLIKVGKPHRNEDIAKDLGYNRSYFSQLLGDKGMVTQEHVRLFKLQYREMLENVARETPPPSEIHGENESKKQSREDLILEEIRHIRKSNDKLIDQQGLMMNQQGTLMETNRKLADKLLSLDVPNSTELKEKIMMVEAKENAIFQALCQLMAKVEHKSQKQVDVEMGKLFRASVEEVFQTGKSPDK